MICEVERLAVPTLPLKKNADTRFCLPLYPAANGPVLDSIFHHSTYIMGDTDLCFLSAGEMAERVRSKQVSPSELIRAHLQQIERLNPKLNAFVQIDVEGALRHARAAESLIASAAMLALSAASRLASRAPSK